MVDVEHYTEHLTLRGSDRPGFIEVETAYKRVIDSKPVEIIVRTRLDMDRKRTIEETERLIKQAAIALLQSI